MEPGVDTNETHFLDRNRFADVQQRGDGAIRAVAVNPTHDGQYDRQGCGEGMPALSVFNTITAALCAGGWPTWPSHNIMYVSLFLLA